MEIQQFTTVLFDIDNTLLDSARSEQLVLQKLLETYGYTADEKLIANYRRINQEYWAKFNSGLIDRADLMRDRFAELFGLYKLNIPVDVFAAQYLEAFSNSAIPMTGAVELCRDLCRSGYHLYTASNGVWKVQKNRMDLAGLSSYFNGFFVSDKIGCPKPNKRFFEYILERLEEKDIHRILMVGDELSADISGAVEMGIAACWITKEGIEPTGDRVLPAFTIHSLEELRRRVL